MILLEISLNSIKTKNNYRKTFKDKSLKELAQSIKNQGVIEPIVVTRNGTGYKLIAGERRVRAAELAGLVTIPAVIKDVADSDILEIQLIENIQREGVPFYEEAEALYRLRNEKDLDVGEIAQKVGKSETYVYYQLKVCKMSPEAIEACRKGELLKNVAWLISRLTPEQQTQAAIDLRREKGLISERMARLYIQDNFTASPSHKKRTRIQKTFGNDFQANWKKYLVNFSCEQFEQFKQIVRGRTDTVILAEAVDMVCRKSE